MSEKDEIKALVDGMLTGGSSKDDVIAWLIDSWTNSRKEVYRLQEIEDDAVRAGYAYGYLDCTDGDPEDAETALDRYHGNVTEE